MTDSWADLRDIIRHVSELETELKALSTKVENVRFKLERKRNHILETWPAARELEQRPHFGQMS